jgi:ribonuclease D
VPLSRLPQRLVGYICVRTLHPTMPHQALYLDTAQDTSRFLRSIADIDRLALDTEGASFHRFVDRIYLLQLSTSDRSAIIDPLPIGAPEELGTLLESPQVEIIFHDADYDLRLLHQDYGWQVRNIFDTRVAAQLLGIRAFGLATLLEKYFGVKLDKKHQRADWSMRPLTTDMLEYASQDTMHLIGLRNRLAEELESMGRWEWAREEFVRLEETRWEQEDDATGFLRLKGARDLNRRELAVLRELVAWRNDVARRADRATFRVLGNEPLLDIARRKPTTREALASIKGMPRSLLDRASGDLLDAIRRGVTLPDAELPRFPKAVRWERDPEFDLRVTALRTAREAAALHLDMDPGVLCSRDRLEAVARRNPATVEQLREVVELRGWQVDVLGANFLSALGPHRKAAV